MAPAAHKPGRRSMWQVIATIALGAALLSSAGLAAPTQAQEVSSQAAPPLRYDPAGPDRDCRDFETWEEAQAFYLAAGGPATRDTRDRDPHRLDTDFDGIACESLPGSP